MTTEAKRVRGGATMLCERCGSPTQVRKTTRISKVVVRVSAARIVQKKVVLRA